MPSLIHRRRIIYPGSGGFLPNQISNLGFWLESDYGITKDGSNAVSEWIARGSRGYTLSQATGANQPIWTANEFGSQAGLIFDGTNDSLERSVSNPFGDVQNFSIFMVLKARNNDNQECFFCMGDPGTTDSFFFSKGQLSRENSFATLTVLAGVADVVNGNTAIKDNAGKVCISESNGSSWTERINKTDQTITIDAGANSGRAPGDWTTLENITMGVLRRNDVTFLRSNFAAVLFYERQLSTAERTRVENYLISKYGIAA